MEKKKISILTPFLNESENLLLFYNTVQKVLAPFENKYSWEVVFIDDGSTDNSLDIVKKLAENNRNISYISFARNFGKEIALTAGIELIDADAILCIDSDLQHPPDKIPEFIKSWENGYPLTVGVRKSHNHSKPIRRFTSILFHKTLNLLGGDIYLEQGETDFMLLTKSVQKDFIRFTERRRLTRGLINWLGYEKHKIYFEVAERAGGTSPYSFIKRLSTSYATFISHSYFPLKLVGILGGITTLMFLGIGTATIIDKIFLENTLKIGGTGMMATFMGFLIGIVLSSLGLIALYIEHIHLEITNRPLYIIKSKNI